MEAPDGVAPAGDRDAIRRDRRPPRSRIRVVHFSTVHPQTDTRIFIKQCSSLAKAGFSVTLLAPGDGSTSTVDGVVCKGLKVPQGRLLRMTVGQWRMLAVLLRERADIFHFHDPELLPSALVLRLLGRPVVFDSHEHISKDLGEKTWLPAWGRRLAGALGRIIERAADRFMSGVVITTSGMRKAYPNGRTMLVRNLPRIEEFGDLPAWHGRRPVACYVGLVTEFRGSKQIARLAVRTSAQVVVAGRLSNDERAKLKEEPGWPLVDYRGVLDRTQVIALLSEAQVGLAVLLPMNNFEDSIPTKLLEYLAAGIPVVASDFASWRKLTAGADCVVYVDPADEDAVADAVNSLLADPQRAQAMGRIGRQLVLDRFVWEHEFETLLTLYSTVLGGLPEPAGSGGRCGPR